MPKARLALIDDHQIVRDGLKALLQQMDDCEVVAEGGNGEDALKLVGTVAIDLILMDIAMPGMNGLDAAAEISRTHPDIRIIILSMHATAEYARRALECGAAGYILKNMAPNELQHAIRRVTNGGQYLSPAIRDVLHEAAPDNRGGSSGLNALTSRQQEILTLLAEGMSTRDMAALLSISAKTVETHRSQLMQKLAIYDVPGLVKYAIRHGLTSID